VGRHLVASAAVNDDGLFGTEAFGGARNVHGGIAATIDDDSATEHGRRFFLHVVQYRNRVEHLVGITGRDVGALGKVRTDAEETGVETLFRHDLTQVAHLGFQPQLDTVVDKAPDFGVEHIARQAVLGNAVAHHAAGLLRRFENRHLVAETAQVVGRREAGRPGADHQDTLAGGRRGCVELPAPPDRLVAEKALDRVDADCGIDVLAVAGALAGVIADAAHDRGQRIVRRQ